VAERCKRWLNGAEDVAAMVAGKMAGKVTEMGLKMWLE